LPAVDDLPAGLTPWGDPAWRASVLVWVHDRLRAAGARSVGEMAPRIRPWSVTGRVLTDLGPVWFKANPPAARFEPALARALSQWAPGLVLTPLAVDPGRGWSLLPDGGEMLGDAAGAIAGAEGWEEPLRRYAELQRAVSGHVAGMAGLGVPDLRPGLLPAEFAALLNSAQISEQVGVPQGISAGQHAELGELAPRLAGWCERLAASPVPPSIDQSDLHDYSVFWSGGRYVFFDWGDASIAHPFTSLLVFLRMVAARYELTSGAPELLRLRDVYLEPWTAQFPAADLREEVRLAMRLGAIGRALSWQRIFPEAAQHVRQDHGSSVARWLAHLLEPGLV
jgi:Phosphotransferase enzyme family